MEKLKEPDKKLAARILTEVGFDERLVGYQLRQRMGPVPITMYGFEEVAGFFLNPYPVIDMGELETWIREIMKDEELADRIKEFPRGDEHNPENIIRVAQLMEDRLVQCKKLVNL